MLTINTHQAKSQLSSLIDMALAGESIIIARAGKPTAKLEAIPTKKRVPGKLKGKFSLTDDFTAETDEVNRLFYS